MSEKATAEQMQMPKHGEFCWTEIATANLEKCKPFYSEIFGWNIKASENTDIGMEYLEFGSNEGTSCGGMFEMKEEMYGGNMPPPHFMNYIAVDDVDETARQAFELGGKVIVPPMEIPNVGRFCVIQDPTGAAFSVITLGH